MRKPEASALARSLALAARMEAGTVAQQTFDVVLKFRPISVVLIGAPGQPSVHSVSLAFILNEPELPTFGTVELNRMKWP